MRAWETSQQAFCKAKYGTGYPVPMLAAKLQTLISRERTGKEWNGKEKLTKANTYQNGAIR